MSAKRVGQLVGHPPTHQLTHNAKGAKISAWTDHQAPCRYLSARSVQVFDSLFDYSSPNFAPNCHAANRLLSIGGVFFCVHMLCDISSPIVAAACSCILSVAWV